MMNKQLDVTLEDAACEILRCTYTSRGQATEVLDPIMAETFSCRCPSAARLVFPGCLFVVAIKDLARQLVTK
jgi:hypothetical protein